jgi:hypothetical protein
MYLRVAGAGLVLGAPSVDGGVDAFDALYGSGDAFELELTPLPHPSLDGLAWKLGYPPSPCPPPARICVGSTCV